MAICARNAVTPWAVFASSAGVAALLVACLLSESGANIANAQPAPAGDPDWVVQWLQGTEPDAQPAPAALGWAAELVQSSDSPAQEAVQPAEPTQPAQGGPPADDPDSDDQDQEDDSSTAGEPDWEAQMQSILRQVANQTFLNNFAQDFTFFFLTEQLYIDRNATILIPTNVGYWRYATQWNTLTPKQKRRLLRYHILEGRYTAQQLLDAAPFTLFPTFNQNLPVNKTLKPNEVYFQSVPPTRFVSPLSVPNAGLTDNIAAHGVTMVLIPPNLN
ncbi:unnamed protein product [Closterium sp. NIES-64]|nr:unnamed protein product [Closterium sp. NIES-65]CAI6002035.1 unnamed protein product [Closterium sp. NIES-64]